MPQAPVADAPRERIGDAHRLRKGAEYAAIKQGGRALRGRFCLVLQLDQPGAATKVGFIASRRSVGDAVHRNRARRRMREIVRRRWPAVSPTGSWLAFIALSGLVRAPHDELVADVERLLSDAGVWPVGATR